MILRCIVPIANMEMVKQHMKILGPNITIMFKRQAISLNEVIMMQIASHLFTRSSPLFVICGSFSMIRAPCNTLLMTSICQISVGLAKRVPRQPTQNRHLSIAGFLL